jgi:hypothetical protein
MRKVFAVIMNSLSCRHSTITGTYDKLVILTYEKQRLKLEEKSIFQPPFSTFVQFLSLNYKIRQPTPSTIQNWIKYTLNLNPSWFWSMPPIHAALLTE